MVGDAPQQETAPQNADAQNPLPQLQQLMMLLQQNQNMMQTPQAQSQPTPAQ